MTDNALLIGLGNPGDEYLNTRHNAGYLVANWLEALDVTGLTIEKTNCYMNMSGRYVRGSVDRNGVTLGNLFVLHDDWDFEPGEYRVQFGRGANHHKGVESIISILGSQNFWRVRIGIGRDERGNPSEHVLGKLSNRDIEKIKGIVGLIGLDLKKILNEK